MAFALLDAACGGILLNAPIVALREIGGQNWHLPLRDVCVGFGMLASLYLGSWMAPRRKMPFAFFPGVLAALSSIGMVTALAFGDAFWFLLSFGIGGMFEIMTRPAIATILRFNYPVAERGQATATVRQWSSLSFMVMLMLSAYALRWANGHETTVAAIEIICAATLGLAGFFCFRQIRVHDDVDRLRPDLQLEFLKNVRQAVDVLIRDNRYRHYLVGCFIEGFFGMLYLPLIAAFLSTTLKFGYIECAALTHGIPTLLAFLTTAVLGRWFVLWWQIGITHFAPPGEDTSRYAGIMVFLNGVIKIAAATAGIGLTAMHVQPVTLLWIGGTGVIASGFYSLWQAHRERQEHRPETFAAFEAQFNNRTP